MTWVLWALFGNDLDGIDADSPQAREWRPDLRVGSWRRRVLWWLRNPLHNLLWHVLGVVDRQTQQRPVGYPRWGRFPEANLPPAGFTWNLAVIEARVPLPFAGLRIGTVEVYLGWRERGNFGGAFRPLWPLAALIALLWFFAWIF